MPVPTRPTVPDPELWGPWLHRAWLESPERYAEELRHARQSLIGAPHGTYGRVGQWGMTGIDPGQPACTCCERRVAGEA